MQLSLDPHGQGVLDTFVELDEDTEGEGRGQHLQLEELIQTLLQRVAQGGVAVDLIRHPDTLLSPSESKNKVKN